GTAVHPPARQGAGQQESRGLRHQRDRAVARPDRRVPHVLRRLHHPVPGGLRRRGRVGRADGPAAPRCTAVRRPPLTTPRVRKTIAPSLWHYRLVASIDLDRLAKTAYDAHRDAHSGPLPSWDAISD